jgi:hypothetical protein
MTELQDSSITKTVPPGYLEAAGIDNLKTPCAFKIVIVAYFIRAFVQFPVIKNDFDFAAIIYRFSGHDMAFGFRRKFPLDLRKRLRRIIGLHAR